VYRSGTHMNRAGGVGPKCRAVRPEPRSAPFMSESNRYLQDPLNRRELGPVSRVEALMSEPPPSRQFYTRHTDTLYTQYGNTGRGLCAHSPFYSPGYHPCSALSRGREIIRGVSPFPFPLWVRGNHPASALNTTPCKRKTDYRQT